MQIIKAIIGGVSALFALGALVNLANRLMSKTGGSEGATAWSTIVYLLLFLIMAGVAVYCLRSAFGRSGPRVPPQ